MTPHRTHIGWYLLTAALLAVPAHAAAQGARLELGSLASLAGAAEVTDLTLDPQTLQMAGGFLSKDKTSADVKDLVAGLQGVYVKSFEFKQAGAYDARVVEPILKQLSAPGWSKMVSTRSDGESVEIYSWRQGTEPGGLAIVVLEPREVTVVNIVGRIDLQKLAGLQGLMGIPNLPAAK
jgi:hypothetical protein